VVGASATKPQPQIILNPSSGALSFDPDGIGELPQQMLSDFGLTADGLVIGEKANASRPQIVLNPTDGRLSVDMDGTGASLPVVVAAVDAPALLSSSFDIFKNFFNRFSDAQPSGSDWVNHSPFDVASEFFGNFESWIQKDYYSDISGFFDHACSDWFSGDRVSIRGTTKDDDLDGTPGHDVIRGLSGSDNLKGLAGDDWIRGGLGDDQISGGVGEDRLWGGDGLDRFSFDSLLVPAEVDIIKDFHAGIDKIDLSATVFSTLTPQTPLANSAFYSGPGAMAAQTADQRIIFNTTTGALLYDSDGMGGVAARQFATLWPAGLNGVVGASDFNVVA
jgi:Ca2+-binding RTX toxin-like protein